MPRRATHLLGVLGIGLATMATAQALAPVTLPLFDGVVVNDPYRYLTPPFGTDGSPTSAVASIAIQEATNPSFAVYTSETPPQAELLAHGGELTIGAGGGPLKVTIDPVAPPATASGGIAAGNVYRVSVTDASGAALALTPGQSMTLAMRGPAGISAAAAIARFVDGAWRPLPTQPSGLQDLFLTNIDAFGDFALLGAVPDNPSGIHPELLIAVLVVAGLIVLFGLKARGTPTPGSPTPATTRRRPKQPPRTRDNR